MVEALGTGKLEVTLFPQQLSSWVICTPSNEEICFLPWVIGKPSCGGLVYLDLACWNGFLP